MSTNLRPIHPNDSWVMNESNKVVGVQTTNNSDKQIFPQYSLDPATGAVVGLLGPDGAKLPVFATKTPILQGASAGANSGWLPISSAPERFAYQLDSGSTATTFSVDISADGASSLGQALTGTWASSALAEITYPVMFSDPRAKFFRWNVVSGGPLSVYRGA